MSRYVVEHVLSKPYPFRVVDTHLNLIVSKHRIRTSAQYSADALNRDYEKEAKQGDG